MGDVSAPSEQPARYSDEREMSGRWCWLALDFVAVLDIAASGTARLARPKTK